MKKLLVVCLVVLSSIITLAFYPETSITTTISHAEQYAKNAKTEFANVELHIVGIAPSGWLPFVGVEVRGGYRMKCDDSGNAEYKASDYATTRKIFIAPWKAQTATASLTIRASNPKGYPISKYREWDTGSIHKCQFYWYSEARRAIRVAGWSYVDLKTLSSNTNRVEFEMIKY